MWLLIILLLTGCNSNIEIIPDTTCSEIIVNVKGEVYEEGEIILACDSTFTDLLNEVEITEYADISVYHPDMPLFDGDIIEIPKHTTTKVSINYGSKEELMTLSGIGEKTAQAIIDYRNTYGLFTHIDDLKSVKGIGDKKLAKIKVDITL